jgi:hypothetical protein
VIDFENHTVAIMTNRKKQPCRPKYAANIPLKRIFACWIYSQWEKGINKMEAITYHRNMLCKSGISQYWLIQRLPEKTKITNIIVKRMFIVREDEAIIPWIFRSIVE